MAIRHGRCALVGVLLALGMAAPASAEDRSAAARGNPAQFFGPDAYPIEAIRLKQEGRVVVKLWLDDTGKVASCTVDRSSGVPVLDQRTCEIALAKLVFTPAQDRRGRPIAAQVTLPVRWILPEGPVDVSAHPGSTKMSMDMVFSVDSNGVVLSCSATSDPVPLPGESFCDEYKVGSQTQFRWMRDGRRVGGMITRHLSEEIAVDP